MALKFLNKKGWHTGSLRNIENVWKAEQKHEQEQRKLEELRKNIQEERDRDEFRQLQVQAGITPAQERLDFLYDSGLAVGKKSNEGFAALPSAPVPALNDNLSASASAAPSSSSLDSCAPGALFEDKPQSANDAWRKLHSDPLLMIRQREQEALARIKNNPVKMAMIRKSVEMKKKDDESRDGEQKKGKAKHKKHSSSKRHPDSDNDSEDDKERKRKAKHKKKKYMHSDEDLRNETRRPRHSDSDEDFREEARRRRRSSRDHESEKQRDSSAAREKPKSDRGHLDSDEDSRDGRNRHRHSHREQGGERHQHGSPLQPKADRLENRGHLDSGKDLKDGRNHHGRCRRDRGDEKHTCDSYSGKSVRNERDNGNSYQARDSKHTTAPPKHDLYRRRGKAPQLTEEERAAKLREMQMDAELHEQQRWKRLKKADEDDAREASKSTTTLGKSFLDDVQKSVYGTEKGGSSTIEESVRRRSHFLQGRSGDDERNAFRR